RLTCRPNSTRVRSKVSQLPIAEVRLHLGLSDEIVLSNILDNTDHLAPWRVRCRCPRLQTFADRILSRPEMLRSLFADHHHVFCVTFVAICEIPATESWYDHRGKVDRPMSAIAHDGKIIRQPSGGALE